MKPTFTLNENTLLLAGVLTMLLLLLCGANYGAGSVFGFALGFFCVAKVLGWIFPDKEDNS